MPGPELPVVAATNASADLRRAWVAGVRRVVRVAFDAALVVALAFTVFVAYGIIGNRWYHVVGIEGGSMEPTITRGDLIVVTPLESAVEPGMILTMGVDGRVVTHRVIAVMSDGSLVTRGDANELNDDWRGKPITVFGQYKFTIPALGRFLPISNASGASFNDQETATQRIVVGDVSQEQPAPAPAGAPFPIGPPAPTPGESSPSPSPSPTPPPAGSSAPPPADPAPPPPAESAQPPPAESAPPPPADPASPTPAESEPPAPPEAVPETLPPELEPLPPELEPPPTP